MPILSGEEKPACVNCQRQGETCDYSVRLNWGGRTKRTSIDSPSSQSSGYAGTIIGFTDPIPTSAAASTRKLSTASNVQVDGFMNVRSDDLGSLRVMSPNTSTFDTSDVSKTHSDPEELHSSSRPDGHGLTAWAEHSSLPTSTPCDSLSRYSFGQAFNGSYSPVANQGVGLRSLSMFAFDSNAASQPLSFLRNSVDVSTNLSDSPSFQDQRENQLPPQYEQGETEPVLCGETLRNNWGVMSRSGGIDTLLLGPHGLGSKATSSSCDDGIMRPARSESVHSVHLADDSKESDQVKKDSYLAESRWQAYLTSVTDNYGLDCGRPDRDLALNNDHDAIDIDAALAVINSRGHSEESAPSPASRAALDMQKPDFSGYYETPVPINIPRYLSPLPTTLLQNPINLMYFHHFLNHTCRMLVPHDCDNNPFMSVLPASKLCMRLYPVDFFC